jgi:sec-independent protein translocase protein TatA
MGSFSVWHWLVVLVVILIVFGAGKLPRVAGDLAASIKNFRKGMAEGNNPDAAAAPPQVTGAPPNNNAADAKAKDKVAQG